MPEAPLLRSVDRGLYCEAGDFFIDPWLPVERALVTHAHSDHAARGCGLYVTASPGAGVLRRRMGPEARIETLAYGEARSIGGIQVSLHPAGHILGSAQIRLERGGDVWVVSGDYKIAPDPTCAAFEPVRCRVFVTESTFGLPIYRWPSQRAVLEEIAQWRSDNQMEGLGSILFAYALGKAQRLLAGLDLEQGPIYCHGAVEGLNQDYRAAGVRLPETLYAGDAPRSTDWSQALVLAPPSANGTPWMRRFRDVSTAFVSGWMLVRGARRRRAVDRGFVLSDHADWDELQQAIAATGAERVLVTHGASAPMVRWLREQGLEAEALATRYTGEQDDSDEAEAGEPEAES